MENFTQGEVKCTTVVTIIVAYVVADERTFFLIVRTRRVGVQHRPPLVILNSKVDKR